MERMKYTVLALTIGASVVSGDVVAMERRHGNNTHHRQNIRRQNTQSIDGALDALLDAIENTSDNPSETRVDTLKKQVGNFCTTYKNSRGIRSAAAQILNAIWAASDGDSLYLKLAANTIHTTGVTPDATTLNLAIRTIVQNISYANVPAYPTATTASHRQPATRRPVASTSSRTGTNQRRTTTAPTRAGNRQRRANPRIAVATRNTRPSNRPHRSATATTSTTTQRSTPVEHNVGQQTRTHMALCFYRRNNNGQVELLLPQTADGHFSAVNALKNDTPVRTLLRLLVQQTGALSNDVLTKYVGERDGSKNTTMYIVKMVKMPDLSTLQTPATVNGQQNPFVAFRWVPFAEIANTNIYSGIKTLYNNSIEQYNLQPHGLQPRAADLTPALQLNRQPAHRQPVPAHIRNGNSEELIIGNFNRAVADATTMEQVDNAIRTCQQQARAVITTINFFGYCNIAAERRKNEILEQVRNQSRAAIAQATTVEQVNAAVNMSHTQAHNAGLTTNRNDFTKSIIKQLYFDITFASIRRKDQIADAARTAASHNNGASTSEQPTLSIDRQIANSFDNAAAHANSYRDLDTAYNEHKQRIKQARLEGNQALTTYINKVYNEREVAFNIALVAQQQQQPVAIAARPEAVAPDNGASTSEQPTRRIDWRIANSFRDAAEQATSLDQLDQIHHDHTARAQQAKSTNNTHYSQLTEFINDVFNKNKTRLTPAHTHNRQTAAPDNGASTSEQPTQSVQPVVDTNPKTSDKAVSHNFFADLGNVENLLGNFGGQQPVVQPADNDEEPGDDGNISTTPVDDWKEEGSLTRQSPEELEQATELQQQEQKEQRRQQLPAAERRRQSEAARQQQQEAAHEVTQTTAHAEAPSNALKTVVAKPVPTDIASLTTLVEQLIKHINDDQNKAQNRKYLVAQERKSNYITRIVKQIKTSINTVIQSSNIKDLEKLDELTLHIDFKLILLLLSDQGNSERFNIHEYFALCNILLPVKEQISAAKENAERVERDKVRSQRHREAQKRRQRLAVAEAHRQLEAARQQQSNNR